MVALRFNIKEIPPKSILNWPPKVGPNKPTEGGQFFNGKIQNRI